MMMPWSYLGLRLLLIYNFAVLSTGFYPPSHKMVAEDSVIMYTIPDREKGEKAKGNRGLSSI